MDLWRICRERYVDDSLSGLGAETHGGRWNPRGLPMVYTSESLSLAILELLVHVELSQLPPDLRAVRIAVPGDLAVTEIDLADLPRDWRSHPAPAALQEMGEAWLTARETPILRVPSAVNPIEHNRLLDPRHPDLGRVRIVEVRPLDPDLRLR